MLSLTREADRGDLRSLWKKASGQLPYSLLFPGTWPWHSGTSCPSEDSAACASCPGRGVQGGPIHPSAEQPTGAGFPYLCKWRQPPPAGGRPGLRGPRRPPEVVAGPPAPSGCLCVWKDRPAAGRPPERGGREPGGAGAPRPSFAWGGKPRTTCPWGAPAAGSGCWRRKGSAPCQRREDIGPLLNRAGKLVTDNADKAEDLNTAFASVFTNIGRPQITGSSSYNIMCWLTSSRRRVGLQPRARAQPT